MQTKAKTRFGLWKAARLAGCLACAFAFACALSLLAPCARAHALSDIDYDGGVVAFYTADLSGRFGMLSNTNDDVEVTAENGMVTMRWVPSNARVYSGFYLHADKSSPGTWNQEHFVPITNGMFSFSLPDSCCGHGIPVAPLKSDGSGGTTDKQYYLCIPPLEKIKPVVRTFTVTFTNGLGSTIEEQQVAEGEDAVPPLDPSREGFSFAGWDRPFTGIAQDTTVNALWMPLSGNGHLVTFENGYGGVVVRQVVEDGKAATAPSDPTRDGYTFTGWSPADFSSVKDDMTVTAQWISNEQLSVKTVSEAIDALPADPKSLLCDTDNEQVAATAVLYNAMPANQKDQVDETKRMQLAKCAIAVLPSDAFKVTAAHGTAISAAQAIYDSLPAELQGRLDGEVVSSSRSYGRYLQNAAWALDGLRMVNNVTLLPAGTYTGQVTSTSSMGKSNSKRSIAFTVKSVMVTGGRAMAILEHGSNSSQSIKLGGIEYQNLQTDPTQRSYFEIPINLNSTFHFSVKGKNATDDTDAITYEMTVSADETSMTPDVEGKGGGSGAGGSGGAAAAGAAGGSGGSGSGVNLNTLVTGSSKKSSGDSANAAASAEAGQAGRLSSSMGTAKATEVDLSTVGGAAFVVSEDLMPAVAGVAMLLVSLGMLGFTLRFIRRENASS